ncbi:MAG TPA: universal stress protein, partial [Polyangiaceae bacterium]|nr:universal stress protein [Polyangiaceae bacterium]
MANGNRIETIFHPSDFSAASEVAFAHALKLALATGAKLRMLHVGSDHKQLDDFPGVRETLERWQLIPPGSPKSAVAALGIDVAKVVVRDDDPVSGCLRYLEETPADLIVLAVHQNEGKMRWLDKSIGKPMARRAGE